MHPPHYRAIDRYAGTTFPVRGKYFTFLKAKIRTALIYTDSVTYTTAL